MLGIIGGTNFKGTKILKNLKGKTVATEYGNVDVLVNEKIAFLNRHGKSHNIPPHRINHKANIKALKKLGTTKIIGICSVGSLRKSIKPGSILIPSDYVNFWGIQTFFDSRIKHITPELDEALRKIIIKKSKQAGVKIIPEGIYVQTTGPRLETKAEIKILKNFCDVVGMNLASEATLAQELGIGYAGICSVDNYANGVVPKKLDFETVVKDSRKNSASVMKILIKILEDSK